jgi:hypothetical protein
MKRENSVVSFGGIAASFGLKKPLILHADRISNQLQW